MSAYYQDRTARPTNSYVRSYGLTAISLSLKRERHFASVLCELPRMDGGNDVFDGICHAQKGDPAFAMENST